MALQDLLTGLTAQLASLDSTISVYLGSEYLSQHDGPPRVVLVPSFHQPSTLRASTFNPRDIAAQTVTVDAHLWAAGDDSDTSPGKDYGACEWLLGCLVTALRAAWGDAVKLSQGEWAEQQGNAQAELGRLFIQRFTMDIQIAEEPVLTAVVQVDPGANLNTGMTFPSGAVSGNPPP